MHSIWRYVCDLRRSPAYDGASNNNDGESAVEEDETDGVCSNCGNEGEGGESEGAEDFTEDAAAPPESARKSMRKMLQRRPSRMKICFDVSQASVRLQRGGQMQRTRRSTLSESIESIMRSFTATQSNMGADDEEEMTAFMSEKSFWGSNGQEPRLAEIAFDSGTTHYCIVSERADPEKLCEHLMLKEWGLTNPKLILSIMGGAGMMKLDKDKFDIESFSKGLVEAALRTGAWVTTGGTKSGVMDIVGKAMKEHDKQRLVPCIGISPLGGLKASWRKVLLSGGRENPKVDAANALVEDEPDSEKKLAEIQDNHTHSILCDNGKVGMQAFGSEVNLRAALEAYLGTRHDVLRSPSRSPSASPGRSPSSGKLQATQVPRVMILVNGGKISLKFVLEFIETRCPVVVCRGTGRVADLIGSIVEARGEGQEGFDFDEEYNKAVDEHMSAEKGSLNEDDREKTRRIAESSWVEVYTINKRLEDVVLRAVLGNPSTRTTQRSVSVRQQLMLAVQWGCTDYFDTLGRQLVQECGGERDDGPAKSISVIFQELVNVWQGAGAADRQSEIPESSGALIAWLLKNHLKQMDAFEVSEETLGKIEWHQLGGNRITRSLEGLLLWCIERDAPSSVLETIWMYMEDPVHAALVAASACRERGTNRFGSASYSDTVAKETLDNIADRFEKLAILLLEELATTGKGVEYLFQESDRYNKYNCFRLAHHLACRKFVSATFYRLAVDRYWRTPLPFSIKKEQLATEYLNPWNLLRLSLNPWRENFSVGDLLSIPYIKCCTHGISRCAFIALYSYAVFYGLTYRRGFSVVKLLLFLWGLGFGMVEVNQYEQKGSAFAYFSDFWNVLDALVIVSLLVALAVGWNLPEGHAELERTLEVIHSLNLLPTWIRVGQVLQLDQELGTLFLTMGGMCKDALRFLVLVSIVCLGFSCALTPMLFKGAERDSQGLLWAFWTIVGSIDEKALAKIHVDSGDAHDGLPDNASAAGEVGAVLSDAPGPILGPLTHVLFYTLVLVSNVLLVNLLIAVMNSTYERNMENSQTEWAFYRVQTVLEFDEWADLPPPLNLFELVRRPFSSKSDEDSDGEPKLGRTSSKQRNELPINKRDLKDSQQRAIATVGLEEDAGEIAVLRADNTELRRRNAELMRRKEEIEGLAANFLIENGGLPGRSVPVTATPSAAIESGGVRRLRTEPHLRCVIESSGADAVAVSTPLAPFPARPGSLPPASLKPPSPRTGLRPLPTVHASSSQSDQSSRDRWIACCFKRNE